jgi:DNA-binding NtrC family response regulator
MGSLEGVGTACLEQPLPDARETGGLPNTIGGVLDAQPSSTVTDLSDCLSDRARRLRELSIDSWGEDRSLEIVGHSPAVVDLLVKAEKIARFKEPVLITGESGVGKELLAQAIYLLGRKSREPYVSVNCPQYREGNLTASELFGHRKGSFTGAVADRKGAWEEADGGVIFLDEIADLHVSVQAMLLRALSTGEYKPLGDDRNRTALVRVVAATNRPLNKMMIESEFRHDLFFRLRRFHVEMPSLRNRGDDWLLILQHTLLKLRAKYGVSKRFSSSSLKLLRDYSWPGNVRQVISVATTGYAMADGRVIEPRDFASQLDESTSEEDPSAELYEQVRSQDEDFWQSVYQPFMKRDLNRAQVRRMIKRGLTEADGNYRKLVRQLGLRENDYQRFMDFLRHHDLKPH